MNKQLKQFASLALAASLGMGTSVGAFAQGSTAGAPGTAVTVQGQSAVARVLQSLGINAPAGLGIVGTATIAIIGSAVIITQVVDGETTTTTVGTTTATTIGTQ